MKGYPCRSFGEKTKSDTLRNGDSLAKQYGAYCPAFRVDNDGAATLKIQRHVAIAAQEAGDLVCPRPYRAGANPGPEIGDGKCRKHARDRQREHDFHQGETASAVTPAPSFTSFNRC